MLIKGGDVLEKVYELDIIVFDKIGILIIGYFIVINIVGNNLELLLRVVVIVESGMSYFLVEVIL